MTRGVVRSDPRPASWLPAPPRLDEETGDISVQRWEEARTASLAGS